MDNEKGFKVSYEHDSLKRRIQSFMGHLSGVSRYKDQVDTLYFFLNKYLDVQKLPVAEGEIRRLQKCDTVLLDIFDTVCKKNRLTYWIDAGTLLGAVRHGGFIPWDDDIDVIMPREDYCMAAGIIGQELSRFGIDVRFFDKNRMSYFGLGFDHDHTGIWLDVFPADLLSTSDPSHIFEKTIKKKARQYIRAYKQCTENERLIAAKKNRKLFQPFCQGKESFYYLAPEFNAPVIKIMNSKVIFPLQSIRFEDHVFYAPNDVDAYLRITYGNDYMKYPRSGILHHGVTGDRLSSRASRNGVDLESVKDTLLRIRNAISK